MIRDDDKRFYELSAKQAQDRIRKRTLAKSPARVYDREELRKGSEPLLDIETKYELKLMFEKIFGEKKEAKA
jgi:hypothetical protein